MGYICLLSKFKNSTFLVMLIYRGNKKTQILRAQTLILHLALYLIFITMSKTKHPANVEILTESEHFVHISALLIMSKTEAIFTACNPFRFASIRSSREKRQQLKTCSNNLIITSWIALFCDRNIPKLPKTKDKMANSQMLPLVFKTKTVTEMHYR